MSGYVNIGRTDDAAYRYKMPRLMGKVEGRGNGIKTVVVNIVDLGAALHRDPDEVLKFMGCELGAQIIWIPEQERGIVNGAHTDEALQALVHLYVDKFVLCPTCKYPETSYKFKLKRDYIYHTCKACGAKDALVDEGHRLCKFILNKVKLAAKADAKGSKKDRKARKGAKGGAGPEGGETSPPTPAGVGAASGSGDVSPEQAEADAAKAKADKKAKKDAKKAKKAEKKAKKKAKKEAKKSKGEGGAAAAAAAEDSASSSGDDKSDGSEEWASAPAKTPSHSEAGGGGPAITDVTALSPAEAVNKCAVELAAFIAEGKDTRLVIEKLTALQLSHKLLPVDRLGILFTAAFVVCAGAADFLKAFTRFKTIFRQLVTGDEKELVACFDRYFAAPAHKSQLAVVPLLLKLFHDAELLSEALAREWYESPEPIKDRFNVVDAAGHAAVKAKAKTFIDQLDESSDDDSSSDS
jgi:translation initiation factor 5